MKKTMIILVLSMVLFLSYVGAFSSSMTANDSCFQFNTMDSGAMTTNRGTDNIIGIDGVANRGLVQWDLLNSTCGNIPITATVTYCQINFTNDGVRGGSYVNTIDQVLIGWTQLGSTWNTREGSTAWQSGGAQGANDVIASLTSYSGSGNMMWTDPAICQGMINGSYIHGFVFDSNSDANRARFWSSAGTTPPSITVIYDYVSNVALNITDWIDSLPSNNTIHNSNTNFYFNVTDADLDDVDCSVKNNNTFIDNYYNVTYQEQPFVIYNISDNEISTSIFYLECNDSYGNWVNSTEKTIFFDNVNPIITWNNPSDDNQTFMQPDPNRFNITAEDNNLYRINITCWKLGGDILFSNYTDAWTDTTYIFNEEVNINEAGNYTCEVDSTDSHTGKIIGEIDTKKGSNYVQVGDVKLSMTGSTATTLTKKSDRYSIEMQTANVDLKQKTYTLKLESTENNEVVIPKATKYKGHILIFDKNNPMSGMWFDTEPYDSTISFDGKVATITIKTSDNTLKFNSIGILNNITEYASFSTYGIVDTGYAKNTIRNYYLFGNVTTSIAFSEVRWTVQSPTGTLTLNAQNSSSYDGITWNSSSLTLSEEGVYNWTAEAYEGGQLWSTGTGSFTSNFTNITWSIANTPDTCTTLRYRFTAFDEQSRGITNFSMKTSFVIISGIAPNNDYNTTIDYNVNNVGDVQLCIDSADTDVFKLTAMTEYYGDVENGTHSTSNYYITNVQSSTPEVNFTMGMLPTNSTALVLLKVVDNAQTALQDYTIYVQKYYVEDNSYQLVRMAKTNDNGEDIIPLEFYNAWYRFLVYDTSQNLVYIGSNTKVYSGTLTITISPATITETLNKFKLITTSLAYTNNTDTGTFTLIYSDGSGAAQTVCLAVHRQTISVYETVCESCLTSASGTIYCTINNTLEGTYTANAYATINPSWLLDSETVTIITDFVRETFKTKIGKEGLLWTIALALTVALAFGFNPVAGIIAFLITLIAAAIMGLISVSYGAMAVLAIVIGIIAYKMGGRS